MHADHPHPLGRAQEGNPHHAGHRSSRRHGPRWHRCAPRAGRAARHAGRRLQCDRRRRPLRAAPIWTIHRRRPLRLRPARCVRAADGRVPLPVGMGRQAVRGGRLPSVRTGGGALSRAASRLVRLNAAALACRVRVPRTVPRCRPRSLRSRLDGVCPSPASGRAPPPPKLLASTPVSLPGRCNLPWPRPAKRARFHESLSCVDFPPAVAPSSAVPPPAQAPAGPALGGGERRGEPRRGGQRRADPPLPPLPIRSQARLTTLGRYLAGGRAFDSSAPAAPAELPARKHLRGVAGGTRHANAARAGSCEVGVQLGHQEGRQARWLRLGRPVPLPAQLLRARPLPADARLTVSRRRAAP